MIKGLLLKQNIKHSFDYTYAATSTNRWKNQRSLCKQKKVEEQLKKISAGTFKIR
jgi:hypothetical protein